MCVSSSPLSPLVSFPPLFVPFDPFLLRAKTPPPSLCTLPVQCTVSAQTQTGKYSSALPLRVPPAKRFYCDVAVSIVRSSLLAQSLWYVLPHPLPTLLR